MGENLLKPAIPLSSHGTDRHTSGSAMKTARKVSALAAMGFILSTNALDLAFDRLDGSARANSMAASAVFGHIYDIYTLAPLDSAVITLNGTQYVTGPDGYYAVGAGASGVPETPPVVVDKPDGFGCSRSATRPASPRQHNIQPGSQPVLTAGLDTLAITRPGHWSAKHYVGDLTGIVQINASLPRNVSPRYNIAVNRVDFANILNTYDVFPHNTLFTYLPSELPIPVDGTPVSTSDKNLMIACASELNSAVGAQVVTIAWGNGLPEPANPEFNIPEKRGIYVNHNAGENVTQPVRDSDTTPTHLIGAICNLKLADFRRADHSTWHHEVSFRAGSYISGDDPDGIFNSSSALPMTNRNRDYLQLRYKFAVAMEAKDASNHTLQDLKLIDFARP